MAKIDNTDMSRILKWQFNIFLILRNHNMDRIGKSLIFTYNEIFKRALCYRFLI